MTLVLLWRVPERRVGVRWRGPAGLVVEIERDPLAPVAAVVGPPGPAGSALGAVFTPLAVAADAPAPVPQGGVGSAAWSTLLDKPVIWDGSAWRAFAYFSDPALPNWWAENALADLDMVSGRYYLDGLGECSVGDVLVQDAVNWGPFNPLTDIVPGKGLFAMTASAQGDGRAVYPTLAPAVVAAIREAGGATVICHIRMDYTGTLEGTDTEGFGLEFFDIGPTTFDANIGPQVSPILGNDITVLHYPEGSPAFTRNPQSSFGDKLGVTFDIATNTWLVSNGGSTVPGWTASPPIDFSTLAVVGISMGPNKSSAGDAVLFPSWPRLTIYPPVADQAALNAMTLGASGVPIPPFGGGSSLDFTSGTLPDGVTLARASSATYYDNTGVMKTAGNDVPRYDFTPTSHTPRGLLIEPAATNKAVRSQELDNAWALNAATIAANAATAPDGTATMDKIVPTAGALACVYEAVPVTTEVWTLTFHAKAGELDWVWARPLDNPQGVSDCCFFNLATGVKGQVGTGCMSTIQHVGGGIYRCTVTKTLGTTSGFAVIGVSDADASIDVTPSGSNGLFVWGVQAEQAPATSYIPTAGSTASRAEDQLTITVPSDLTTAHCTMEGGSVDLSVTPGPATLTAAHFGGPVRLQGITFS